ncbi:tRNA (guanine(37)-N1)-methyltransferase [Palaemon carinicauda]|uniref:tRNA (guanine(37)-N1)-methyltransferase n=1 Tax=Palaemon carinicauda TaxID=392227 RepID=UPI0035B68885
MQRYTKKLLRELGNFQTYSETVVWQHRTFSSCFFHKFSKYPLCRYIKQTHSTAWEKRIDTYNLTNNRLSINWFSASSLYCKMDASLLLPPASVKGMTTLDREAFVKKISVPFVRVKSENVHCALKCLKKLMLKIDKLKPVQTDADNPDKKIVLLNPLLVKSVDDIKKEFDEVSSQGAADFLSKEITLCYENWKAEDIIKSILPENQEGAQGYSIIGHVIHLNLRDHVLPYKKLIGEVLLEKTPNITLIVNKTNTIDSTYRNFEMEVLAGTGTTEVTVKENGCSFSFDFAKVYWNPRLGTEHERIVKKIHHADILYDVMAGVGPFAIPAGRKKCKVLANDLNPHSYEALVRNCSSNKVNERVKCFNLDGHEFIKTILKKSLLKTWHNKHFCGSIHVTMNLPAMAVEFLPSFIDLFSKGDNVPENASLPLIHVYMFAPDTKEETAIRKVAEQLEYIKKDSVSSSNNDVTGNTENGGQDHDDDFGGFKKCIDEVVFVRSVSPNKHMMRVSFSLQLNILIKNFKISNEPPNKKLKAV